LAIHGVVGHARRTGKVPRVAVSAVEHHAVLASAESAVRDGENVTVLPVDADGRLRPAELAGTTVLVSVMLANNETGVIQPLEELATSMTAQGLHAVLHTDAIAAAPWLDLRSAAAEADLVSICAHKLGGPVNAGALLVRGPVALDAVVAGGGQERGRRGGTVDVAAAVGLAAALGEVDKERAHDVESTTCRRDHLEAGLSQLPGVSVTARGVERLPGHAHVTVAGAVSDEILFLLDERGVCASAASSCASGAGLGSHVLVAMGLPTDRVKGAVRFTLGPETTDQEIEALLLAMSQVVEILRPVGSGTS
jgi:cysteine desulfurase